MSSERIYLDHAATSFPKAPGVSDAVLRYLNDLGAAPGRSTTGAGLKVSHVIDQCRRNLMQILGLDRPENVIFTSNGTESLNLAIHGLLRPGDRVITSVWEHNSVLRPLHVLQEKLGIEVDIIDSNDQGQIDLRAMESACERPARLVVLTHASNVTGVIQPVSHAGELARKANALFLLDAAQTVGTIPVSFADTGADLIAFPGHKGLRGPLGTGVLAIRGSVEDQLEPLLQGGTGTLSESPNQPRQLPEKYESGNLNAPGIFGLEAATRWFLSSHSQANVHSELTLIQELIAGLQTLPDIELAYPGKEIERVAVVSAHFSRVEPHVLTGLLDEHYQIETRAGLHCAPLAHQAMATFEHGGTVRFSLGPTNTSDDIDRTLTALAEITAAIS